MRSMPSCEGGQGSLLWASPIGQHGKLATGARDAEGKRGGRASPMARYTTRCSGRRRGARRDSDDGNIMGWAMSVWSSAWPLVFLRVRLTRDNLRETGVTVKTWISCLFDKEHGFI